jgi:FkbM family methyltransferase
LEEADVRRSDDLIFDIGMHEGQDTELYLALDYRVVAVEAHPELAAAGRERFAEAIAGGRLVIEEAAISEQAPASGFVPFYVNRRVSTWSTASPDALQRSGRPGADDIVEVEVPGLSIGTLVERHGMPYYLKVDIEGSDLCCIEGLGAFAARPRFLSFEASLETIEHELDVVAGLGYRRMAVVPQQRIGGATASLARRDGTILRYRFGDGASGVFGDDLPPQIWRDVEGAKRVYRRVALFDRLLGPNTPRLVRKGRRAFELTAEHVVPGWFDLHAPYLLPGWFDTHARLD